MRVLGIDPSLAQTGLCTVTTLPGPIWDLEFDTVKTKPDSGGAGTKYDRMVRQATFIVRRAASVDLTVMEAPSFGSRGNATRDLAGLWWLVFDRLKFIDRPLVIAPPAVLKKWITGKGTADKYAVIQAVGKRWPQAAPLRNPDEADALVLASIGLHALNVLPWAPNAVQVEQLNRVEWIKWPGQRAGIEASRGA